MYNKSAIASNKTQMCNSKSFVIKDTDDKMLVIKEINLKSTKSDEIIKCNICEKAFQTKASLEFHISNHIKDFPCHVCCSSFPSQFALYRHLAKHTTEEKANNITFIACSKYDCPVIFTSQLELYKHNKEKHDSAELLPCPQCRKSFSKSCLLNQHLKMHNNKYMCDVCKKCYANVNTLREHKRIHSGEKPYSCELCNMKFRVQSGLAAHSVQHSGERRYKCHFCKRTFSRPTYLKDHLRIHTNDKPYSCNFCSYRSIQATVLKKHVASKHRQCKYCNEMIGNRMQFKEHVLKSHPGDDKEC